MRVNTHEQEIIGLLKDREEWLGEIAMKIWDKMEQFCEQRGSFNAWVTSIARNTALNKTRKITVHSSGEELSEELPSRELTPE